MKQRNKMCFDTMDSNSRNALSMGRVLAAMITITVLGVASYGFTHYAITPILSVPPYDATGCQGIAPNAGYVVGFQIRSRSRMGGLAIDQGFFWQEPGPLVRLAALNGDPWSQAFAVNDSGQAVGFSGDYNSSVGTACLWDGTSVLDLETPLLYGTRANGINSSGLIVGVKADRYFGKGTAAFWVDRIISKVGSGLTESGRHLAAAYGVNEQGQIVGQAYDTTEERLVHAFLWDGELSSDALDLPEIPDSLTTLAFAVNDLGQAVGMAGLATGESMAVFWDADHQSIQAIPGPAGASDPLSGQARAINNAGWVVGYWREPWLWNEAEGSIRLQKLVVGPDAELWDFNDTSAAAMGIDNQCRIAGEALYKGQITTFLLTPVPDEPVTIDIKPGTYPNTIDLKSRDTIPVAILSTTEFDAPGQIDRDSLTFGRTGFEDSLASCDPHGEDVNEDGLRDLVCHFRTEDTGFESGDTEGVLEGKTVDGIPVGGADAVTIVP